MRKETERKKWDRRKKEENKGNCGGKIRGNRDTENERDVARDD